MPLANVAALYVDARGVYPSLVREWYDEKRDARTYAGPYPVVGHPPCGPWGNMAQWSHEDPALALHALDVVNRFGGVLEHPSSSRLFKSVAPEKLVGCLYEVNQLAWGHTCSKPTKLYVVGVPHEIVLAGIRSGGVPTHKIRNRTSGNLLQASRQMRRRTPLAFARWLVSLAELGRPLDAANPGTMVTATVR